jgi:hypothetical protein
VTAVAASGAWIRHTMKFVLSLVPAGVRYFVQPLLILYYAPLFMVRNVTGPTRKRARRTHALVLEGWKEAIERADAASTYWPVHVNADGQVENDLGNELDIQRAVSESVEVSLDLDENNSKATSGSSANSL